MTRWKNIVKNYWKNIVEKLLRKIRNKIGLILYLKRNRIESLNVLCDEQLLEEKWAFKETNCYIDNIPRIEETEMVDLSIIVPLYNSERFIHNCVGDFLNQKTQYKYEVILVNDGSTDGTLSIICEYQKKYPELFVVVDQPNKGISAARNTGLRNATGKYVAFADHDDRVAAEMVEKLLAAAYRENADIVKAAYMNIMNGKKKNSEEEVDVVIDGIMKKELFDFRSYIFPGVFKRELFEHVNFPEGFWYEDMVVRILLYRQATRFVHISDVLYYKNFHTSNASFVVWNIKNYKCLEQMYLVMNLIEENRKLGLPEDVWFYQCIMRELSAMLAQRTRGIDEQTKQMVFLKACSILKDLYREEFQKSLLESNRIWQRVFENREYKLWLLLSGYY